MILEPIFQKNLYELDVYLLEFIRLYKNNKLPNKILLSGDEGLGKSTLAYHLVNFILSRNEQFNYNHNSFQIDPENKSYKLIINGSNPNFTLIDTLNESKNIGINQIRDLISNLNKSSFNDRERFVIIDNIENLNVSSINALLKIIEEPPTNTIFILINNNRFILPTLKSRCINYKIFLNYESVIKVTNRLIGDDIFEHINLDLLNRYSTPGKLYKFIKFFEANKYHLKDYELNDFLRLIIKENLYKKDKFIKDISFEYLEFFFRKKMTSLKSKTYDIYSYFIKRINDTKKFNLDEESLFAEFQYKVLNG